MNSIQTPIAIRTTAAALAVFMTVATLNSLVREAEPQHSVLMAQIAAREAARTSLALHAPHRMAQATADEVDVAH